MKATLILLTLITSLFSKSLGFGKDVPLNPKTRLECSLSTEGINRLVVKGDRITKLVFQKNSLQIDGESHDGSLFISPRMPKDSVVYATLFTEKGFEQPLLFHIKSDISPVTFVLSQRALRPLSVKARANKAKDYESRKILLLLKDVLEGRLLGREAKDFCKDTGFSFENVTLFQKDKFTVMRLETSLDQRPLGSQSPLAAKDQSHLRSEALRACFKNVRATSVDGHHVYVVSEAL